jgi:hypothetical protein
MTQQLSPEAKEVLTAVTLKRYDVPPEGLPGFALEMAPLIAAALRGLVGGNAYEVEGGGWYSLVIDVDDIYAVANELDALTAVQLEAQ